MGQDSAQHHQPGGGGWEFHDWRKEKAKEDRHWSRTKSDRRVHEKQEMWKQKQRLEIRLIFTLFFHHSFIHFAIRHGWNVEPGFGVIWLRHQPCIGLRWRRIIWITAPWVDSGKKTAYNQRRKVKGSLNSNYLYRSWLKVDFKFFYRESEMFSGGRILTFFPVNLKYWEYLCVKLLFRCKLSRTAPPAPFWHFSRGGWPWLQEIEPLSNFNLSRLLKFDQTLNTISQSFSRPAFLWNVASDTYKNALKKNLVILFVLFCAVEPIYSFA